MPVQSPARALESEREVRGEIVKVQIELTSEEAQALLFAVALRSKQRGLNALVQNDALQLGERLNNAFEKQFRWDEYDRMKHYRRPIKGVSIKCYDFPPQEH
jgi:hypothetical protein